MQDTPSTLQLGRFQATALTVGVVGLAAAVIAGFLSPEGLFFQSYLYAFLFWLGLALGCLVLLFAQHLAGGSWGALIRRPLEAGVAVLPVMALFFIPLLFGLNLLYDWTNADFVAKHPLVNAKTDYLNVPFFILRSIIYFGLWSFAAFFYLHQSAKQDRSESESGKIAYRLRRISGPWIVVYVLTMTFAAVDWGMSLTPEWWSGIYGAIFMISQAISAISFIIGVMVVLASRDRSIDKLLTSKRLQDLGNFLMAFTMFWAYISIGQLIILWSNNVVETATWYTVRFDSTLWTGMGLFLLFFGFFAPFLILFSRWVKRKRRALVLVAIWAIFVQLTNLFWFIIPNFERSGFQLTLLDILLLVGIGGIWLAVFSRSLSSRPILPLQDPRLKGAEHA
ncbi:MAG: hypothetical protein JSV66_09530 [Trueperaceae bacterium]|nr:MAG: hypothetical protein JSV66_09530 [Trueperaceae bacterium]